jgi:hypothetical protein
MQAEFNQLAELATTHKTSIGMDLSHSPGWKTLLMVLRETGERPPKRPMTPHTPVVSRRYRPVEERASTVQSTAATVTNPGRTVASAANPKSAPSSRSSKGAADDTGDDEDDDEDSEHEEDEEKEPIRPSGGRGSGGSGGIHGDSSFEDEGDDDDRPSRAFALPNRRRPRSTTEHITKRVKGFRLD